MVAETPGADRQTQNIPGVLSTRQWRGLVTVLLVYFGTRLLFFAFTVSGQVPPDETTHLGMIRVFSTVLGLPVNSPETYHLGLVTNVPWLYYWLMGKALTLNVFGLPDLLFLRLLNIPFAFATVYFVWRTLRLLTGDRLTQLLVIVAMTNTLMFSFLSAAVSYDNLTNLLSAMAIYNLCTFFKERSGTRLGLSWCCQLAGGLVKASMLPLMMILNIVLLIHEFKNLRDLPSSLATFCRRSVWKAVGLTVAILFFSVLNFQLYGGNYLRYSKLLPEMWLILPFENVMQHRISARDMVLELFKQERVSYAQAMELSSTINHDGDRQATVALVNNLMERRYSGGRLLSPLEYVVPWCKAVLASVYGILAHKNMLNRGMTLVPVVALILLAAVAMLICYRPRESAGIPTCLAVTALSYAAFLLYFMNYTQYLFYESIYVALQGRYVFPVIGALYVLSGFYLMRLFTGEKVRLAVAVLTTLSFVAMDFPFFLWHVSAEWFALVLW